MHDALWILVFALDAVVALTAVGGGLALVFGLEAARYGPEYLEGTPFSGYLWPGLMLAVIVGGSAAAAAVALVLDPGTGGLVSLVAGTITAGWIGGEVRLLNQPLWTVTEALYFVGGLIVAYGGATLARS